MLKFLKILELLFFFAVAQIGAQLVDCGMRMMTAVNGGGFGFDKNWDFQNLEFQVYPRAPLYT